MKAGSPFINHFEAPAAAAGEAPVRFRLADVDPASRRSEMRFSMPLAEGVTAEALDAALSVWKPAADPAPDASYAFIKKSEDDGKADGGAGSKSSRQAAPRLLSGLLEGSIDLAMTAAGRWWIIDWKTNALARLLGEAQEGKCPKRELVSREMTESSYRLQYLLYLVAYRRWLRQRFMEAGFSEAEAKSTADRRFGGVFYVFVRWLDEKDGKDDKGGDGRPLGLYFDRPDAALLDALDELMKGAQGRFGRALSPEEARTTFASLAAEAGLAALAEASAAGRMRPKEGEGEEGERHD